MNCLPPATNEGALPNSTAYGTKTSFDPKSIIPYELNLSLETLRNPGTWTMLFFGFSPLALTDALAGNLEYELKFLLAYFALAWAAYFYVFVAKRSSNLGLGLAAAVFTIVIGVPFGRFLNQTLLSIFYGMTTSPSAVARLIGQVFSNGLNEELVKSLPLLVLAFGLHRTKKPLDGIFFGALSGMGFAAWEGYHHITKTQGMSNLFIQAVLLRSTTFFFLHSIFTGITGYFVALAALSRRFSLCIVGLGLASILHGCYDFAANAAAVPVAAFTYLLLTSYVKQSQQNGSAVEETKGC
jgi:RsiW-degrading membrane proteinase PrsW (M82 family)